MSIVDKIETFVNETKEMSLKKVMDKIEDGYWEAEEDVKVGKHVTIRDTKTKKRMTILVTEELYEASELDEINEAEDVHNFVSDMIMDFEKKLGSVISKGAKSIDPTVLKDLKKLEDECSRVRKGKLHDIRPGR